MPIRALLVDDERLARTELRRLLATHPTVTIVGEAANVHEAETLVLQLQPDLLLLDIQMPGATGFDLLTRLDVVPHVIFTTAYDHYALQAFDVNAIDYLLKPIEPERLQEALAKIEKHLASANNETASTPPQPTILSAENQIFVKEGERFWFVRLGSVRLFESEGNYTRLYFDKEKPLIYRSLAYLEERLDPAVFFRSSRKHIINLQYIDSLDAWFNGGMLIRLQGGRELEMSRRQAQKFRERMSL